MLEIRKEWLRKGGDRDSEILDREGAEIVEVEEGDCESTSRGEMSAIAVVGEVLLRGSMVELSIGLARAV